MASLKNLLKSFGSGVSGLVAPDASSPVATYPLVFDANTLRVSPCDGWAVAHVEGGATDKAAQFINIRNTDVAFESGITTWNAGSNIFGSTFIPVKKGQIVIVFVNGTGVAGSVVTNGYLYFFKNSS